MSEEKRFFLFLILTTVIVIVTPKVYQLIWGPPQPIPQAAGQQPVVPDEAAQELPDAAQPKETETAQAEAPAREDKPAAKVPELAGVPIEEIEQETRFLGSTDRASGFKMKVQFSNHGAAVRKIELTDFLSEDRTGPLQLLSVEEGDEGSFLLELKGESTRLDERNWQIVTDPGQNNALADSESISFQTVLPENGLGITKTFSLKKGIYNLDLEVKIGNQSDKTRQVAYRLVGPRGFVMEGAWYARKLRDAAIGDGMGSDLKRHPIRTLALVKGADKIYEMANMDGAITRDKWKLPPEWFDRFDLDHNDRLSGSEVNRAASFLAAGERDRWVERPVRFAGVEGQYFCALLVIPTPRSFDERWDASTAPILGNRVSQHPERSDVSVEIESKSFAVDPGEPLRHHYIIYSGPRKRDILDESLGDPTLTQSVMDYQGVLIVIPSWVVAWTANSMHFLLRIFHSWVGNWGVAIIMLTVLVRMCMFPLSRKQAMSAVKMQSLKPQLDALREKYKNEKEKFAHAQMELWRKHGVNPMGGCLPVLIQMPIFVGLWQGLSSSVDLRQAPFLWIDNLAAPDGPSIPWFEWGENIPLISHFLGPYFNLLPTVLIGLMFIQQKLFMPPKADPPDPQMEMQQKMMTYMMLLFGAFFWRLPSGLCVYYIASTSWGIAERKLLPKLQHATPLAAAGDQKDDREGGERKGPRGSGPDGKGRGKDGKGRRPPHGNGMTWSDRLNELIKKASKK